MTAIEARLGDALVRARHALLNTEPPQLLHCLEAILTAQDAYYAMLDDKQKKGG